MSPSARKERWTLEEWLCTEFELRCEFVQGRLIPRASPTKRHQDLVLLTAYELRQYAHAKQLGTVLMEVDVALPTSKGLIPDIRFVTREREAGSDCGRQSAGHARPCGGGYLTLYPHA